MPFKKKTYRKKRPYRKRVYRKKPMIPRGLRQAIMPLQRDITHFVNTTVGALPTGWAFGTAGTHYNTIQCSQVFHLGMLDSTTDFSNIFQQYKLNCVIVSITNLHNSNQANGTSTSSQVYFGGNIVGYAEKNMQGGTLDTAIEQGYWDQRPGKKTFTLPNSRPRVFKIYPKILVPSYLTATTTQTQPRKSGWLPTTTSGMEIPHYGLNMQFSYVDPNQRFRKVSETITNAPINFRVNYKFLMQFKGIK